MWDKQQIRIIFAPSLDMRHLETTYEGLINETAGNEEDLIKLLKNLSEAIRSHKKKITSLAARQGKLLNDGKTFLTKEIYKSIEAEWIYTSLLQFFISLHTLFQYPRFCYCGVPIRALCPTWKLSERSAKRRASFGNTFLLEHDVKPDWTFRVGKPVSWHLTFHFLNCSSCWINFMLQVS